ncbi:hypothetical protein C2E23DRAFT_862675 [Lenzites betulinus]|nr:hypothetical protein C2E23DRAFT_862675 [Lenzites betulinus]
MVHPLSIYVPENGIGIVFSYQSQNSVRVIYKPLFWVHEDKPEYAAVITQSFVSEAIQAYLAHSVRVVVHTATRTQVPVITSSEAAVPMQGVAEHDRVMIDKFLAWFDMVEQRDGIEDPLSDTPFPGTKSVKIFLLRQEGQVPEIREAPLQMEIHEGQEILDVEPLIPKYLQASQAGVLMIKLVDKLQGMAMTLPSPFIIWGISNKVQAAGEFQLCQNRLIASIAHRDRALWWGDVVVAKLKSNEDGGFTFCDCDPSDYCLIRNYFLQEI